MNEPTASIALTDLGVVRFVGADAVKYLQGQLSNDVTRLTAERSLLAGYHNPQGRVIALLRLVQVADNDLLAILPRELATSVVSRLSKFVLRSKVKIADESEKWRLTGFAAGAEAPAAAARDAGQAATLPGMHREAPASRRATPGGAPLSLHAVARVGSTVVVCVDENVPRWLAISPAEAAEAANAAEPPGLAKPADRAEPAEPAEPGAPVALFPGAVAAGREVWRRLDIEAGLPQVYAATAEEFVAQMLNLDVLGAIAFDKGCYTGLEVIARAHYRGRVKRRLQRFVSRGELELKPGDAPQLTDGRSVKVVEAVRLADGRCEFLAVGAFGVGPFGADASGAASSAAAEAGVADERPAGAGIVDAEQPPLPYALPD